MIGLQLSAKKPDFQAAIKALATDARRKLELVAEQTGQETIDYLRSLTDAMAPPAYPGGAARQRHPGHWADITGQLAASYAWSIEPIEGGFRLVLSNVAEYAADLEAHDGYFVLSGVADPDGPVFEVMAQVAAAIAPEWRVDLRGVKRLELQGPVRTAGSRREPGGGI